MVLCRDRAFYRQTLRLGGFIALQNVVVCFVGLADNVMIGAYSQDALSGVALANQIQFLLQMIMGGVSEGMAVLCSQYWGTRQTRPIRRIMAVACLTAAALCAAFFAAAQLCPTEILGLLSTDMAVVEQGARYMRPVSYSYVFFGISMVLVGAQRSVENVRVGMASSLTGLMVNIALNWALIFGNLGAPRLGAVGAAVATLIARVAECAVAVGLTYGRDRRLAMSAADLLRPDRELGRDFFRVATPVMLSGASWGVAQAVQTGILGHMGSNAIAANAIASSLFQVISVAGYGVASASAVLTGKAVGAGDHDRLRGYVNSFQLLFLAIGVVTGAALFLVRDVVLRFYNVDAEAMELARSFITVLSVTVVGTCYQCGCLTGVVRGGGNTRFVFYNDLIFMWGLVLPLSLLSAFVFKLSPLVVFMCLKSDQVTKCAVAVWQVNSYHWVRRVTRDPAETPATAKAR